MATTMLVLGMLWLAAALTAVVRFVHPAPLNFPVFMTGWVTGDLARFHLVVQVALSAILTGFGALDHSRGVIGLAGAAAGWCLLGVAELRSLRASGALETELVAVYGPAMAETLQATPWPPRSVSWKPFSNDRTGLCVERNISYGPHGKRSLLDVYRPVDLEPGAAPAPVVVQIHGGAWISGHKMQQAQPLLHHLARNGFVAISINYRLAPRTRMPDQVADVRLAMQWVRDHAVDYGGDPERIVVTGGSAGGHLASLIALTEPDIVGAIPLYPATDLTNSLGIRNRLASMEWFLTRLVMASRHRDDPDSWRELSPLHLIHAQAPPFLVVQGSHDTLVYREEVAAFAADLAAASDSPVAHVVLPGAQHAFDLWWTERTRAAVHAMVAFASFVTDPSRGSRGATTTGAVEHPAAGPATVQERLGS